MSFSEETTVRRLIEQAWHDVLPAAEFGPDDNFFDLGGTSLEAVVVVSRLNQALGVDLSDIGLFEQPTVRAMIERLRSTGSPASVAASAAASAVAERSRRRGELRRTLWRP